MEIKIVEQVVFKDKNLEQVVREYIGKFQGTIYRSDLPCITKLDAKGRNIT